MLAISEKTRGYLLHIVILHLEYVYSYRKVVGGERSTNLEL